MNLHANTKKLCKELIQMMEMTSPELVISELNLALSNTGRFDISVQIVEPEKKVPVTRDTLFDSMLQE